MKTIFEYILKAISTVIMGLALYIFNNFQASFDDMKKDISTMKDSITNLNVNFAVFGEKLSNSQKERGRLEKRIEKLEDGK